MGNNDPNTAIAMWSFFGVVITTLGGILIAQISTRRKTEDVKQEVINSATTTNDQYSVLAKDVRDIKEQLNNHIRWHMERGTYVYVGRDRNP